MAIVTSGLLLNNLQVSHYIYKSGIEPSTFTKTWAGHNKNSQNEKANT